MPKSDSLKSYAAPPMPGNPRATEAWALTQAALRMKESRDQNDVNAMLGAVRLNWRLWTIFQAELLDPNSPVPMDIRSNLVSLSNFIDKHTVAFIAEPAAPKLDVLININRDIAGGLYATPPQDQQSESERSAALQQQQQPGSPPAQPPSLKISV